MSDGDKILVAYDSPFGSTGEMAEFIGEILSQNGNSVDVRNLEQVADLTAYDRVIIGGAIRYDRWMSGAAKFVQRNEQILSNLPVAFFFTCLVLSAGTESAERKAEGYAKKLYELAPRVKPVSVGRFAGVLDYSKMNTAARLLARGLFAVLGVKEGDYRDWGAIRAWAESVSASTGVSIGHVTPAPHGTQTHTEGLQHRRSPL